MNSQSPKTRFVVVAFIFLCGIGSGFLLFELAAEAARDEIALDIELGAWNAIIDVTALPKELPAAHNAAVQYLAAAAQLPAFSPDEIRLLDETRIKLRTGEADLQERVIALARRIPLKFVDLLARGNAQAGCDWIGGGLEIDDPKLGRDLVDVPVVAALHRGILLLLLASLESRDWKSVVVLLKHGFVLSERLSLHPSSIADLLRFGLDDTLLNTALFVTNEMPFVEESLEDLIASLRYRDAFVDHMAKIGREVLRYHQEGALLQMYRAEELRPGDVPGYLADVLSLLRVSMINWAHSPYLSERFQPDTNATPFRRDMLGPMHRLHVWVVPRLEARRIVVLAGLRLERIKARTGSYPEEGSLQLPANPFTGDKLKYEWSGSGYELSVQDAEGSVVAMVRRRS